MIRVMIVDDMPIFREYLRDAIDWASYGFEICCEAKNGKEALEMMVHEPDIVLSDITMPFMDGLEFAKILKSEYDQTELVLITGNAEFEYAKQAVKLGVADYIVKPFEKEELIVTLLSLKDNIEKAMEQHMDVNESIRQRDELFKKLIYSTDLSDMELPSALDFQDKNFVINVIETEAPLENPSHSEQALSWKSVIGSLYKDYVPVDGQSYLFRDYEERVILLSVLNNASVDLDEMDVLIDMIKDKLNLEVTIGIGQVYSGIAGIRTSYLEALNALNNRFVVGSNKVIYYKNTIEKGYKFYSAEINESIINDMNQLKVEAVIDSITSIYKEASDFKYNIEYRRMISMGLMSLLLSYVVKIGKTIDDIFTSPFKPYFMIQQSTEEGLEKYIINCYEKVIGYLKANKTSQSSVIASQAKACMDENFSNPDLSMTTLTKKLLVNQTYLRKMFKSEYNMTISEYMVKIRMEHAKDYIMHSNYKLSAIAEMVGYNDAGYFSRSFKKYFGVSPSEYSEIK